jgi:hypothetical protein
MNRKTMIVAGVMMGVLALSGRADQRGYVWTYDATTMPKGMAEAEYYVTAKVPDTAARENSSWQHQAEIEYGLTDRLDISMYQMWKESRTAEENSFTYEGFKLRSRYQLLSRGSFLIDPLLYVEYIRKSALEDLDVLEVKLVLSKDIGTFHLSYNQVIEQELGDGSEAEHAYACGARVDIRDCASIGIESKGNYTDGAYAVGPTLAAATESLWLAAGVLIGLNDRANDLNVRLIVGLPF